VNGTPPKETPPNGTSLNGPLLNGIGAALLLALATWLWVGAADIDGGGGGMTAPDGFPRLVAVLLGASSLLLLVQSIRAARERGWAPIVVRRPRPVVAAIVLVAVYPLLIATLGYYVATAAWMVPFLLLAGMRHPAGIAASTLGFLLFTKVLFQTVLGTPLP
jgi:hypothetical protein